MPLYEYKCRRCQKTFEVIQKFSDRPLTVHEDCGGELDKVLSPPALQFKGSGWYVTDYGRGGKSGSNGSSQKPTAGNTSKTESKPEAKEPAKPAASSTPEK